MAELLAVNVVSRVRPGHRRDTAIDKQPVRGPVAVSELGLDGDIQRDTRNHGGPDKALYAYAIEDYAWWWTELERSLAPGTFGENLTTTGLDINAARIGEVWSIGGQVRVEVRSPRTPCGNLSHRIGIARFHRRFDDEGRVGAYLKVLQPGEIKAGDRIAVVRRPSHAVTIMDWTRPSETAARELLAAELTYAHDVQRVADRLLHPGRKRV